jgi:urease gamma subunit
MRHAHIYLVKRPKGRAARLHHHETVTHCTSRLAAHAAAEARVAELARSGREFYVLSHLGGQALGRLRLTETTR